jgi:CheY-like chemotaxis protein
MACGRHSMELQYFHFRDTILYIEGHPRDVMLVKIAAASCKLKTRIEILTQPDQAKEYLSARGAHSDGRPCPTPQVVLLDAGFPDGGAWELVRWIRSEPDFAQLPLILCSGEARQPAIEESYEAGADYFLCKTGSYRRLGIILECLEGCLATTPPCFGAFMDLPEFRARPGGLDTRPVNVVSLAR